MQRKLKLFDFSKYNVLYVSYFVSSFNCCFLSELIQELINRETLSDVAEVIEKLFSEIENLNKESHNEGEKTQVQKDATLLNNNLGLAWKRFQEMTHPKPSCLLVMTG